MNSFDLKSWIYYLVINSWKLCGIHLIEEPKNQDQQKDLKKKINDLNYYMTNNFNTTILNELMDIQDYGTILNDFSILKEKIKDLINSLEVI